MPKIEPVSDEIIRTILNLELYFLWDSVTQTIDSIYDMDKEWHRGGKAAQYELKFRRGGKTLVSLFPREDSIGLMVILGKAERDKFETQEAMFSTSVVEAYQNATTFHDGKWIMYQLPNDEVVKDLPALLAIKRKPNRK